MECDLSLASGCCVPAGLLASIEKLFVSSSADELRLTEVGTRERKGYYAFLHGALKPS